MSALKDLGQKLAHFFGGETDVDYDPVNAQAATSLNMNYLSSLLPYRLYDPVTKIFENKSSYGFFFELAPLLGLDTNSQRQISALIRDIGEDEASVQCMIWSDPRIDPFLNSWAKPRNEQGGIYQKMAHKKCEFFKGENFKGDIPPRIFRIFFSYSVPKPAENKKAQFLKKLSEKRQKTMSTLNQFKSVLDSSILDFLDMMSGFLNFEQDTAVYKRKKWSQETYLADQICLPGGGLEISPDAVCYKGKEETLFKTYEAIDFPDYWSMALQEQLIGDFMSDSHKIPCPFYIHYGIHFPKQEGATTKIKAKSMYLKHQTKSFGSKAGEELDENAFVSSQLQTGEKIVETRLSVGLWSRPKDLIRSESAIESLYRKYGFKLQQNKFHHLNDLLFSLPMAWGESSKSMHKLKHHMCLRTTYTVETSNFISMIAESWGNSREGMIFLGRRGQISGWDSFKGMGNYNVSVVGPSGKGKSVFMQDMMLNDLARGRRVFVIDIGRSYEKLCKLLGGQHLFFNSKSNLNLNPFQIVGQLKDPECVSDCVEIVSSIIGTMAMPKTELNEDKMNMISSIVEKVWNDKKEKGTVDDVIRYIKENAFKSELMKGLAESLCLGLEKYTTKGSYRHYFYGTKRVNFSSNFVLIETEELKGMEDLQAVIMQVFVLQIKSHIFLGDREFESRMYIDEAESQLRSPQMGPFIGSATRTTRKYRSSIVVGTQSLKDFKISKGAEAAYDNSSWLVVVGGDPGLIKDLQKNELIPNMDESLAVTMRSMKKVSGLYGESFIYDEESGLGSVHRLYLDPFSAMLYSTKAEEFYFVQRLMEKGLSVEDSIEWLVDNKKKAEHLADQGYKLKDILDRLYVPSKKDFDLTGQMQKISASKKQPVEIR